MAVYAGTRSFERGDVELGTRQESDRSESWNETLTVEFEYRNALRIALDPQLASAELWTESLENHIAISGFVRVGFKT